MGLCKWGGAFAVIRLAPGADPNRVIEDLDRLLEPSFGEVGNDIEVPWQSSSP